MRRRAKMAGPGDAGGPWRPYGCGMGSRSTAVMVQMAALARITEIGGRMAREEAATATLDEQKAADRAMWALGDYHRFAKATVWELGPVLVEACRIGPGQRVLDVAAGTGNVAIRAAEAGADVVASDLTPENFDAGRREARERGVQLEWVEADAEALPFGAGEFDVVTSSLGAMFAPDHRQVADELLRVCKPGGTIGMINFTPEGLAADFFGMLAGYAPPPPPGALPPLLWGSEEHVRELFGDRVDSLVLTRSEYVERAATPRDYVELFNETFGPVIAVRGLLADQPERAAALDRESLELAERANRGASDGAAEYSYGYLLVVARKRAVHRSETRQARSSP
jgi:2-polyprenyl-3-methyl-5-hydroxy-6-metoxy-1,4-benzoquinol methylase